MPLEYEGTISEHAACRNSCAMFDVSHLGTVRLSDGEAADRVQNTLTNDLGKIEPGRAQYTHLLNTDGGVLDDIIVWWHHSGVIDVMPNASNTASVRSTLGGDDITTQRAVIAVQGPAAKKVAAVVCPSFGTVGRFRVEEIVWNGAECTVAGTGYTGEAGLEISIPSGDAAKLWHALAEAGATPQGSVPVTHFASRRASRYTVKNSGPTLHRCRQAWAGLLRLTRSSLAKTHYWQRKLRDRHADWWASRQKVVVHRGQEIPSCATARRSATSHQGTFHRCFSTGLRWALSQPIWPSVMRLPSTFAARSAGTSRQVAIRVANLGERRATYAITSSMVRTSWCGLLRRSSLLGGWLLRRSGLLRRSSLLGGWLLRSRLFRWRRALCCALLRARGLLSRVR